MFATVDLAGYIKGIAMQAARIRSGGAGTVRLQLGVAALTVTTDPGTPLGLLAKELISHAFKHGLTHGHSGDLSITLAPLPDSVRFTPAAASVASVASAASAAPAGAGTAAAVTLKPPAPLPGVA